MREAFIRGIMVVAMLITGVATTGCNVTVSDEKHPVNSLLAGFLPKSRHQQWRSLVEKLSSPDADLRREGVVMLGTKTFVDMDETIELLTIVAKGDPDEHVRATAVSVLGRIRPDAEETADVVETMAKDRSAVVRRACVLAAKVEPRDWALPILQKRLVDDDDVAVRGHAASALGEYRDRRSVRSLIRALDDYEFEVTYQVRQSLMMLTGEDHGYDRQLWQEWLFATPDQFKEQTEQED